MEPEPVAEPTPAPASERPVRAAAQRAAQKKAEEAEAAAKKKAAGGKASAAALQKKLAAQKEAASAVEASRSTSSPSPRGFLRVGVKGGARDARSGVGAAQKLCHVGGGRSDWRICWVRGGGRRGVVVAERGHGSGGSGSGRV